MTLEQIATIFVPLGVTLVKRYVVPDALGRNNVTIEEGIFSKN
jgi:hypothetical protein